MSRNKGRIGDTEQKRPDDSGPPVQQMINEAPETAAFSFVVPTEFVELPSKGRYYPSGHPLHNQETLEIKQMTAKEEDILTSQTLLRKGIALDRVIQSLICDKSIDPNSLLMGDKNALIVAIRATSYGPIYETAVDCPACGTTTTHSFNLNDLSIYEGRAFEGLNVAENDDGTFTTMLPRSGAEITFKLLNGHDERKLTNMAETDKKKRRDRAVTRQLGATVVSVNGSTELENIRYVVENMPSADARHLRTAYRLAMPDLNMTQEFFCSECSHSEDMDVPLSVDFFWPE